MTESDQPSGLTRMRRAVVRTVTASAQVPQYSVSMDLPLVELRTALERMRQVVSNASVSDVVNRAAADALRLHAQMNSSYTGEGIVRHSVVNLAFIVEVDDGMVAPAILNAGGASIVDLVQERIRLTAAALSGSLTPAELLSGTFTISNLGTLGVHRFNAMLIPPQAGILAVGAPTSNGQVSFTLTCDHRVVDGAPAARFLTEIFSQLTKGATS